MPKYPQKTKHLENKHNVTHVEVLSISKQHRAVKRGMVQQYKPIKCPVPSCKSVVCQMDIHLKNIHKFASDSDAFKK